MPSDEEILKALGLIQQTLAKHTQLFADQDVVLHEIMQKVTRLDYQEQMLNAMQQDVRMIRVAINDMEKTRFTSGEVTVLHEDLNRLQKDHADLAVRVGMLEERLHG